LDLQRCVEAGMNNVVLKPMNLQKLQEAIDLCFWRRGRGQANVG
jgi:CheY-like chemotaxis protein